MAILITGCLQRNLYDLVIELCGELISSYPTQSSETLMQVVNHFYMNFQNIKCMSFDTIVSTIRHLSNLAVAFCPNDAIEECMYAATLSTYLSVVQKITGQQSFVSPTFAADVYQKWKFSPAYSDDGFQLDINCVISFVQRLFPLLLRSSGNLEQAIDFLMKDTFTSVFKPLLLHMEQKGQGMAAVRTMLLFFHLQMEFLRNKSSTQEAYQLIKSGIKDAVIKILMRMIDSRRLDLNFGIGLLSLFPTEPTQILQILQKWCTKDLTCVMSLGEIGFEFYRLSPYEDTTKSSEYDKIYRRAALLIKQKVKTTCADIALRSLDTNNSWDVVNDVILCPKVTLPTVLEFCSAFDLVTDYVLVGYLNNLLLEAEKYCVVNSEICEDKLTAMLNQAKYVIEAIASEELVVKHLESMLKKVGSYSYEILIFLHEQILKVSADVLTVNSGYLEASIQLLNFLRVYVRVSPIGEHEKNLNSQHPTDSKMPTISSKRLPFWQISDKPYKIINPELTADTLPVWTRIAPLLKIPEDELVIISIKNTVTELLKNSPGTNINLTQDSVFLRRIFTMLKEIKELELAVNTASWVGKNLPPGVNKVYCCKLAVQFVDTWIAECPREGRAVSMREKLISLLQLSHIEQVLHQYNSASDKFMSYAKYPVKLIEHLIEQSCDSTESSIKACKISCEIAKAATVDLNLIFFNFFHKWLTISSLSVNLEEVTFDFTRNGISEDDNIDKNILRTINLLLGISAIQHDICENLDKKMQKMASILRIRLVFCLVSVYGADTIGKAAKMPTSAMAPSSLTLCLCSSEIESLHLTYSIDMIVNCNKIELVQKLLSDQCNNIKVLLLCVRLCLEYKIWEACIWNIYFQRLVELSMADSLENILQTAQGHLVHMWHYDSFISAWNCIISSYFKNKTASAVAVIEKVQKAILSCKCATALDLESLWNDLKYFMKSSCDLTVPEDIKEKELVLDIAAFIEALQKSKELLTS